MKIAIDAVGIRFGGGAAVLEEMLQWLPIVRPTWTWHVFVLPETEREFSMPDLSPLVQIEEVGSRGLIGRAHWICCGLPKGLRRIGADAVFAFANIGQPHSDVPQVIFCHQMLAVSNTQQSTQSWVQLLRIKTIRFLIARGIRATSAVIVQTSTMKRCLQDLLPKEALHIFVVPSGWRTAPKISQIRLEKRRLIAVQGYPKLIYVAHPYEHKNHVLLVAAMMSIRKIFPQVKLLLTVPPPGQHVAEPVSMKIVLDNLYESVRAADMEGSVLWLGTLNPDEVDYALRASTLMVFPSLCESFGLPLVEAMAAGCPIAAADLPYAREVAGDAAVYFPPDSSMRMAQCLCDVLANKPDLERLRTAGRQRSGRYSYSTISNQVAEVLENAITASATSEAKQQMVNSDTYFDLLAGSWSQRFGPNGSMQSRVSRFTTAVTRLAPPHARILDFGCGSGDISYALADAGYQVDGIDQSSEMIACARATRPNGIVTFRQVDRHSAKIPMESDCCDFVLASSVLEYLHPDSLVAWLSELRRVCRPNACLVATVPNMWHPIRCLEAGARIAAKYLPLAHGLSPEHFGYLQLSRTRFGVPKWSRTLAQAKWQCTDVTGQMHPLIMLIARAE